jgi:phosphoserine phosphatase
VRRPEKLLVLDVEGTLFKTAVHLPGTDLSSTIWQGIAHRLGPHAVKAEVETHRKWADRKYASYLDWMRETIEIHRDFGLSEAIFSDLITSAEYESGVADVLNSLDRDRFEIVLISGGFRELAARAQRDFAIHHAFAGCEYLFRDGVLVGYNLLPCDFEGKFDFINLMLREYSLGAYDWVFVGDGANDVPIAHRAPLSISVKGHPAHAKAAKISVSDFSEVLNHLD